MSFMSWLITELCDALTNEFSDLPSTNTHIIRHCKQQQTAPKLKSCNWSITNNAWRRTNCAAILLLLWLQKCKSLRRVASRRCDRKRLVLSTDVVYRFYVYVYSLYQPQPERLVHFHTVYCFVACP